MILEGLRNLGGGVFEPPKPSRYATGAGQDILIRLPEIEPGFLGLRVRFLVTILNKMPRFLYINFIL